MIDHEPIVYLFKTYIPCHSDSTRSLATRHVEFRTSQSEVHKQMFYVLFKHIDKLGGLSLQCARYCCSVNSETLQKKIGSFL